MTGAGEVSRFGEPRRRKRVEFPYHYSPDKKLVHVVVRFKDYPGSLAGLLALLAARVNLFGTEAYRIDDHSAIFSGFAETISSAETADGIKSLVDLSPNVVESQVRESFDGLLVDEFHTGLQSTAGEPFVILPASWVSLSFNDLFETFGSGGDLLLFRQGKAIATAGAKEFVKFMGPEPATRVREAYHIFEALGYGEFILTQNETGTVTKITVEDCFECKKGSRVRPRCSFLRGLIVGSLTVILGEEPKCEEVRCRFAGNKFCEFRVDLADGGESEVVRLRAASVAKIG